MSTPAYVKKLTGVPGTGKKLFRDRIMDAGFVGHFDFASDYVRNGYTSGAVPVGKEFRNLVDGGAPAVVTGAFAGGMSSRGLVLNDTAHTLRLPDSFIFGPNETHFAIGIALRGDPAASYGVSQALSLAGYGYQNGAEQQWGFTFGTDANGALVQPYFRVESAAVIFPSISFLTDGKVHFLIGEFEVLSGGATVRRTAYLDGVQVAQQTSAFDGALNQVANPGTVAAGPVIGRMGGYTNNLRGSVGRIWAKRFANDPNAVPVATIAAAEYAAYATRFGV